ncbi:hypothetical protein BDV93DRAFT_566296 [Ceratobasidium sp. AG-I]|nr:hypothetical protein BDV93DRAFT_566296 [Ceratobasidium sp. AG-I]
MTSTGPGGSESPCESSELPLWGLANFINDSYNAAGFTSLACNYSGTISTEINFNIQMQSTEETLLQSHLPYIWLSNKVDSFRGVFVMEDQIIESLAPWFTPPWQLKPGFHLEANAKLIIRRFISSSILSDVVLQREPTYEELSMYPISTIKSNALNDNTTATASIALSFQRQHSIFNHRQTSYSNPPSDRCDYIVDYRSSTVFDVIGSVGGLFALLQSLHVLLFGRPMLWGLTGAKLITPFGLLGACSSRGFKKRLHEHYHHANLGSRPNFDDAAETIRIGAFLRDFVIDFGPADVENAPLQTTIEPDSPRTAEHPSHEQDKTLLLPPLEDYHLCLDDSALKSDGESLTSDELEEKV